MIFTKEPFLVSVTIFSIPFFIGISLMNTTKSIKFDIGKNTLNNDFTNSTEITFNTKYILENNIKVALLLYSGAFTLGVSTIFYLIYNGILHGTLIGFLLSNGTSIKRILVLYIPHGIFELLAMWLAGAAGLKGPQVFYRYLQGREFVTVRDVKEYFALVTISVILLIIAAYIETNITPKIAYIFPP
jgi:uncharacterized membrane protein SpoIIM required for sporulation